MESIRIAPTPRLNGSGVLTRDFLKKLWKPFAGVCGVILLVALLSWGDSPSPDDDCVQQVAPLIADPASNNLGHTCITNAITGQEWMVVPQSGSPAGVIRK